MPARQEALRRIIPWQVKLGIGALAATAAIAAFVHNQEPHCEGQQRVTVQAGEDPRELAKEHIDVTSGYLDINSMVENAYRGNEHPTLFHDPDAEINIIDGPAHKNPNITGLQPGDILEMPKTCSG